LFEKDWHSSLSMNYRRGFWDYSKRRLFVLSEYLLSQENKVDVVHIESDVWLNPAINLGEEIIANKISFPKFSNDRASGSIMLISAKMQNSNLQTFKKFLLESPALTDMQTLQLFLEKFPRITFGLRSNPNHNSQERIFDAAPLGMHLFGEDPRNRFGLYKKYGDYSYLGFPNLRDQKFNVANSSIEIGDDKSVTAIVCLHIHSKATKVFSARWERVFKRSIKVRSKKRNRESQNFSMLGLIQFSWDYARLMPSFFKRKFTKWLMR
jgi:hypothetical protein